MTTGTTGTTGTSEKTPKEITAKIAGSFTIAGQSISLSGEYDSSQNQKDYKLTGKDSSIKNVNLPDFINELLKDVGAGAAPSGIIPDVSLQEIDVNYDYSNSVIQVTGQCSTDNSSKNLDLDFFIAIFKQDESNQDAGNQSEGKQSGENNSEGKEGGDNKGEEKEGGDNKGEEKEDGDNSSEEKEGGDNKSEEKQYAKYQFELKETKEKQSEENKDGEDKDGENKDGENKDGEDKDGENKDGENKGEDKDGEDNGEDKDGEDNEDNKKWCFVFGINFTDDIKLPKVPLFGNLLGDINLQPLLVLYASDDVNDNNIKNFILDPGNPSNAPNINLDINSGFSLVVNFKTKKNHKPLVWQPFKKPNTKGEEGSGSEGEEGSGSKSKESSDTEGKEGSTTEGKEGSTTENKESFAKFAFSENDADSGSQSNGVEWIPIQQTLGSLHFKQIGIEWKNQKVGLLLDASLELSVLSVTLDGFGVNFPLSQPFSLSNVAVELDGLAIAYQKPPVNISGGLLHSGTEYVGDALIELESWSLGALGAFGNVPNSNQLSLFVFGAFSGDLGAIPPVVFKGLAGGFGYDRELKIPDINGVASFPLVQYSDPSVNPPPTDPMQVLDQIESDVPIDLGAYWLAGGIHVTAFELIDAFALLTVDFGVDFEIALLGMAGLTVPSDGDEHLAEAEMAIEVSYTPAKGLLEIGGELTSASYILSPNCNLTGGFAFYIWFSGEHGGDFVVTLGGYSPKFTPPSYYPSEPQVGFNWKVSDLLTFKGGIYFALTPQGMMAGGQLEADFNTSVNITIAELTVQASLNASVDLMLDWKPFHYDASFQVNFSGSFTVSLLVTITASFQAGVGLHLYGPPFAGDATFSVYGHAITISFGDSGSSSPSPISWSEFETSFLPANTDEFVNIRVAKGLLQDLTKQQNNDGIDYVINPHLLNITTKTLIPAKTAEFNRETQTASWNSDFGVQPVGASSDDFSSDHSVTITYNNQQVNSFQIKPILTNSPTALWGTEAPDWDGTNALVDNTLAGFEITVSSPTPPDELPAIPIAKLLFNLDSDQPQFNWSSPDIPTTDSFNQSQAIQSLEQTIADTNVNSTREVILDALVAQGLNLNTDVEVNDIASSAGDVLLAPPVLSLLGEEK